MTPTVTVTNPPPPATMPPTPGPGDVRLGWVEVTVHECSEDWFGNCYECGRNMLTLKPPIPKPKWAGGDISKQHRQKDNRK